MYISIQNILKTYPRKTWIWHRTQFPDDRIDMLSFCKSKYLSVPSSHNPRTKDTFLFATDMFQQQWYLNSWCTHHKGRLKHLRGQLEKANRYKILKNKIKIFISFLCDLIIAVIADEIKFPMRSKILQQYT